MKFIFVIGVEGSGHDMLRALMQEVIKQPYFVIEGHWRKVLPDYWNPEARYKGEFGFLRNMSREKVKNELHNIFRNYAQELWYLRIFSTNPMLIWKVWPIGWIWITHCLPRGYNISGNLML